MKANSLSLLKLVISFVGIFVIFLTTLLFHYANVVRAASNYRVGPDYHSTGVDMYATNFINKYNDPVVRQLVLDQVQGMANAGASIISTRYWLIDYPTSGNYPGRWGLTFPPSAQELDNIKNYVTDISKIQKSNGEYLDIYLDYMIGGCSVITVNDSGINPCGYNLDQVISIWKNAMETLVNTVGDIKRPDGQKAVKVIFFLSEFGGARTGSDVDKLMRGVWPSFTNLAKSKGITPSIYFLPIWEEGANIFESDSDPNCAQAIGHKSMCTLIGEYDYFAVNGLVPPERIEFSFYPRFLKKGSDGYKVVVDKIMSDAKAVFPGKTITFMEAPYYNDAAKRLTVGQSFVAAYQKYGIPNEVTFWTTPGQGTQTDSSAYPFDFAAYLPPGGIPTPTPSPNCTLPGTPATISTSGQNNCTNTATIPVTFNWSAVTGATSYYLRIDDLSNGWVSCETAPSNSGDYCLGGITGTSKTVNLPVGKNFNWWVSAFNSCGQGTFTASTPLTTCTNPPPVKAGDTDGDGDVDFTDFQNFKNDFNTSAARSDFNKSGKVDIFDYNILVANFGK